MRRADWSRSGRLSPVRRAAVNLSAFFVADVVIFSPFGHTDKNTPILLSLAKKYFSLVNIDLQCVEIMM